MLIGDVTYVLRRLRHRPLLFATASSIVAFGIAATTAVFSLLNTFLLQPLSYRQPDRLVYVSEERHARSVTDLPFSTPNFFDVRNGAKTAFEDVAALQTVDGILPTADNAREPVHIAIVTPNLFRVLGVAVGVGRDFRELDAEVAPAESAAALATPQPLGVVVLSYEYWQRRYGGAMSALDRPLFPGGPPVVGVLAPRVELLFPAAFGVARTPEVYLAGRLQYDAPRREVPRLRVVGRLKPGATVRQAQAEADEVAARLRKEFVTLNTSGFHIKLQPMHEYLVALARPALLAMIGGAVFLLLIACTNVANLLLVETSLRERELAVRTALGAGRRDIARLLMLEGFFLVGIGTLLGVALATLALGMIPALTPEKWPRLRPTGLDRPLLAMVSVAAVASTAIVTSVLAWYASGQDVQGGLQAKSGSAALGRGRRLRDGLVVAQVALSFVLLTGMGLMLRTAKNLHDIDRGYDAQGLLTFQTVAQPPATPAEREVFMRQIRERLARIPGVLQATAAGPFPLADVPAMARWGTEETRGDLSALKAAEVQTVLPGYFETLRTSLRAGRAFVDADNVPGRNVVVIDEWLAAKAFPGQSAVGKRLLLRARTAAPESVEVLGVVAHQRTTSLVEPGREQVYVTDGFMGHGRPSRWAIRVTGHPATYASAVRAQLSSINRLIVLTEVTPMQQLLDRTQADQRFTLALLGSFAIVASVLAAVGLYGAVATVVRQRTSEVGVRMAMGASPASIRQTFVLHGMRLGIVGLGCGLVAAVGLMPLIRSVFVGITPTDPVTFAAIAIVCGLIVAGASWLPSSRAARLDPSVALREP